MLTRQLFRQGLHPAVVLVCEHNTVDYPAYHQRALLSVPVVGSQESTSGAVQSVNEQACKEATACTAPFRDGKSRPTVSGVRAITSITLVRNHIQVLGLFGQRRSRLFTPLHLHPVLEKILRHHVADSQSYQQLVSSVGHYTCMWATLQWQHA
jgi:hypothetical protein